MGRQRIDVVCFSGGSGLTDYSVSLCRSLSEHACVRLVSAASLPGHFDTGRYAVSRAFRRTRHYAIDYPRYLLDAVRRRPDWIVLQSVLKSPLLEGLSLPLLSRAGIRLAMTVHDVLPHYPSPWSAAEYGWLYRRFDRLIVHSRAAQARVRELGFDGPVLVVPHGRYDIFRLSSPTSSQSRARLGLGDDVFVVLFFGHLEPRKGFEEFVRAAHRLVPDRRIHFLIAGADDVRPGLAGHAESLALARRLPNVTLHDRRIPFEEVEHYFSAADVVALPYREGTTSGVLRLAAAFDKPVVATAVGDLAEEIAPGTGIILDPGGDLVAQLCDALPRALARRDAMTAALAAAPVSDDWASVSARYAGFLAGR